MGEVIDLAVIRLDGGTQPRASIDLKLVRTYAEDMARDDAFPPPVLYFDGADYWLADGFHRVHAAKQAGKEGLSCTVRQGTQRDAILYSVGANAEHGLRRTNEDKRRAVLRLLNDPEWATWADRDIARHCRVDHKTVAALRPAPADTGEIPSMNRKFVHPKTGKPATMKMKKKGRAAPSASEPPPPPPSAPPPDNTTFQADRFIHARVVAVAAAVAELPSPADAARRYPTILRGGFSAERAREIADWFGAFAAAWEAENGEHHVAA